MDSNSEEAQEPSNARRAAVGGALAAVPPIAGLLADRVLPGSGAIVTVGATVAVASIQEMSRPIMNARSQELAESVDQGFASLQQGTPGFDLDDPVIQEKVTTTFLRVLPSALRTRSAEKLFMLRNAVLNSALPSAPNDDVIAVYTDIIDSLTPFHIRMLTYLTDPDSYYAQKGLSRPAQRFGYSYSNDPTVSKEENEARERVLREKSNRAYEEHLEVFAELFDAQGYSVGFCNAALQDLFARGFLNSDWQSGSNPMPAWGIVSVTTEFVNTLVLPFAHEFLNFLKDPVLQQGPISAVPS